MSEATLQQLAARYMDARRRIMDADTVERQARAAVIAAKRAYDHQVSTLNAVEQARQSAIKEVMQIIFAIDEIFRDVDKTQGCIGGISYGPGRK